KMKSDAGSIMSRINSLTDTTGLRVPHNCCGDNGAGSAGAAGGGAGGLGEEQAERTKTRQERQERREGFPILPFLPFQPLLPVPITCQLSTDRAAASAVDCSDRAARPSRAF